MAKKSRLDELENVDGPFQVPDSMFDDAASQAPGDGPPPFSDDDVEKIMGEEEQSWVTEGEPELAPPEPPPPPPALPDDGNWVTQGEPEVGAAHTWVSQTPEPAQREENLFQDVSEAPAADLPASDTPSYIVEEAPKPKKAAPADTGGLVMHVGDEEPSAAPVPVGEDLGTSALTWMSLAIGGVMVGILGAILVVLLFTTATGPVEPSKPVIPESGKEEPEGIQVRRGLNGPPGEPKVTNPEEEEEEEEEAPDGAPPSDVPDGAPPSDVPDGAPPP